MSTLDDVLRKLFREEFKAELKALRDEVKTLRGELGSLAKSAAKSASVAVAKAPPAEKAKSTPKKGEPWEGSASDFIRSMPGVKASEVCEAGEAAGLSFSAALVYQVRANDKKNGVPQRKTATVESKAEVADAPEAEQEPITLEQTLENIEKVLKNEVLSVKNVILGLKKRKVMPNVAEAEKYISYLLDSEKTRFVRVGNGRYRKLTKAEHKAADKTTAVAAKPVAVESKPAPTEGHGARSAFIREALLKGLSVKEVIEAGKKAGLSFSDALVYQTRSSLKKSGGTPNPKAPAVAESEGETTPQQVEVVAEASSDHQPVAPVAASAEEETFLPPYDPHGPIDFKLLATEPPDLPIEDPFASV